MGGTLLWLSGVINTERTKKEIIMPTAYVKQLADKHRNER